MSNFKKKKVCVEAPSESKYIPEITNVPRGDQTINDLELVAHVSHINIFSQLMKSLDHISTKVNKPSAEGWANRGRISSNTTIGPLLCKTAWINLQMRTHLSAYLIDVMDEKEADVES